MASKRRANGEGSLRRRSNGHWQLTVMKGYSSNGKRSTKSFTRATQREALDAYRKYEASLSEGLNMDANYTFPAWADLWFAEHKKHLSASSQEGYTYTLRILKEELKDYNIKDIKPLHIETVLDNLQKKGVSRSYLSKFRGMLHQIMNKAEANDLIRRNPVPLAEKIRCRTTLTEKETYTMEECARLMAELPNDRIGMSIRLLLGTGMRTQELLALSSNSIEPDGSIIHIDCAAVKVRGTNVIGPPKSETSKRTIYVPESIRDCAIALRKMAQGRTFIWESPRNLGSICASSYFRNEYTKAIESIPGMRVLSPHCCRHTFVSLMQGLDVSLEVIQKMTGHSNLRMTQHYLHPYKDAMEKAADCFSKKFPSQAQGAQPKQIYSPGHSGAS